MISVNLLPPEKKEEIAAAKRNGLVVSLLYRVVAVLITAMIVFGGFYYYFQTSLSREKNNYNQRVKTVERYGTLENTARKVADRLSTIKNINQESSHWSSLIEELNTVVPPGVTLSLIKMDTNASNRGQISGNSASKNNVAAFRDALEKSNKFQYVDIESSTTQEDPLTKREVENFTITFSLEKGALK